MDIDDVKQVVAEAYCTWWCFLENIESFGVSFIEFMSRVKKCKTRNELETLVGEFI